MKLQLIRNRLARLLGGAPLGWILAALVVLDGYLFLQPGLSAVRQVPVQGWRGWLAMDNLNALLQSGVAGLPRLMLGAGLQLMALGLILRARIAWAFSLLLLIAVGTFSLWQANGHVGLAAYTLLLVCLLVVYWRQFDRSSLAAGSLFAVLSIVSLLIYAVYGSLYLGDDFQPKIHDAATALYFSIVSMSTVGYGDITPQSTAARLFSASIIILGITVFATSVSAIVGPIIGGNLKRLVKGRLSNVMRKNHIIIAGATPLAQSVYEGLRRRGHNVTVVVPDGVQHGYPADADLIQGDPTDASVLTEAGAPRAEYVLALRDDDAENAFIVLAAKEIAGPETRTVALANTTTHLQKIKSVNPDMVFSLQLLGSEILLRTLSGEPLDSDAITRLFFARSTQPSA
ncbi:voltage-gated potassium channel protein [Candidimonas humi]|uniref:Voltage-gated potassium channel protein n=1 Tax=Candidimonas humi TaxID=683355 RepID=A0ABV8NVG4_9BURK|nr:voltage-gated potassium channel protein [Candidimonas humi]